MDQCFRLFLFTTLLLLIGCGPTSGSDTSSSTSTDDGTLAVVATTNLIGEVVGAVGGEHIALTTLMGVNEDPHTYEPTPQDLVALEQADLIFVNGWDLEEQLAEVIEENYADKMVEISHGVTPIVLDPDLVDEHGDDEHADDEHVDEDEEHADEEHADEEHKEDKHADEDHDDDEHADEDHDEHDHGAFDPHVWMDPVNYIAWIAETKETLSSADSTNATAFAANAADFQEQVDALAQEIEEKLKQLPVAQRKLVTNHDSLRYFAAAWEFEVVGTAIPSFSTSAEPSASDLAELVEAMRMEGACTIFVEEGANERLAEVISAELESCPSVQVLSLYIGSLGDGDASSYVGMYRQNVATIIKGLSQTP